MNTLIIVEHDNKKAHPTLGSVITAAQSFGAKPILLVAGYQCRAVAEQAAKYPNIETVWHVDKPCFEHHLVENLTQLILQLPVSFNTILAAATTFGKDLLPRLAAQLDVAQISEVTRIMDTNTFERPIYAGNAIETVQSLDIIKILTIRPTAFAPAVTYDQPVCIKQIDIEIEAKCTQFISQELSHTERPNLGNAKIIVAGGRGLQNPEKFKLIEELADVLGAAVGASRAAVDAGFIPNDYQVGQTGKVVAPHLYFAIGISGAVQHLAGMKDSKVIVAINKDEDAPIFNIATYGLVGDLFTIIPELIAELKKRQSQ